MIFRFDTYSIIKTLLFMGHLAAKYPHCFFRRCSSEEIIIMLRTGKLFPKNFHYISMTKSEHIPSVNCSDFIVVYNADKVYDQGGIEVEYTPEFMRENNEIFEHIASEYTFEGEEDDGTSMGLMNGGPLAWEEMYDSKTLRAHNLPMSTTMDEWLDFYYLIVCDDRKSEEEVVVRNLKIVPGLLVDILYASDELPLTKGDEPEIEDALNACFHDYFFSPEYTTEIRNKLNLDNI